MRKILILGAGNAQIDAIEYCRERNIWVAGCSYTNTDKGIPLLDEFRQTDIRDVEGVAKLAKDCGVDAIYSVGSDLAVPTIMKASEMLGLPHFISSETAENCHSKHLMRQALGDDFEGNARFTVCDSLEQALEYTEFPGMMKPVDSQGQRGCFRVDGPEDIKEHFHVSLDYSIEGKVIIEEFIDGPEISVNSYMVKGELKLAVISDRYVFDEYPGGIIKEHSIPTEFAAGSEARVIDLVKRSAARLGLNNGPAYYQIKLAEGGRPVILEVAPRLDGCHMWNLIKHYCGADMLDACFTQLLDGEDAFDGFEIREGQGEYRLIFMCEKTGEVFDRSKFNVSGAEFVQWYLETGDTVRKLNGYMEKCGYMICKSGR